VADSRRGCPLLEALPTMTSATPIPTEPIGSIPRPHELIEAAARKGMDDPSLDPLYEHAIRDTINSRQRFGPTTMPDMALVSSKRSAKK
jgi:hypothetical protein